MWKVFGCVGLGLLLLTAACSSDGKNEPGPDRPYEPGPGPVISHCQGGSCDCKGGLKGQNLCIDDQDVCSCTGCEGEAPRDVPTTFQACGGEPFGTWVLTEADVSAVKAHFARQVLGGELMMAACPATTTLLGTPNVLLKLDDGGSGAGTITGFGVSVLVMSECAAQVGQACGEFKGCEEDSACGTCHCSMSAVNESPPDSLSWSRTGAQLSLMLGTTPANYEYCVDGDTLSLYVPETELVLRLQRTYAFGEPLPCAERAVDKCSGASAIAQDNCHVGICTGAPAGCANASDEAGCTNQQGCSWDTSQCSGNSAQYCGLDDYGVIPGCELSDQPPVCSGTPSACADYDTDTCPLEQGCTLGHSCQGPSKTCNSLYVNDYDCASGCSCSDEQGYCRCTGTSDCTKALSESLCESSGNYGCVWTEACAGALPDCASLTADTCYDIPGCGLTAQ